MFMLLLMTQCIGLLFSVGHEHTLPQFEFLHTHYSKNSSVSSQCHWRGHKLESLPRPDDIKSCLPGCRPGVILLTGGYTVYIPSKVRWKPLKKTCFCSDKYTKCASSQNSSTASPQVQQPLPDNTGACTNTIQ